MSPCGGKKDLSSCDVLDEDSTGTVGRKLVLVRYLIPTIFIDTCIWFDTRYSILDTFAVNLPKTYKPIVQPSR